MRKKRSDRNYVIYQVLCESTDDRYIGVTVAQGRAYLNSVKVRFQKHMSRARRENKDWTFCKFLKENSEEPMQYMVLDVVRGRKNAYQKEREYIREYQPTLNDF